MGEAEWGVGDLYRINHMTACTGTYGGYCTGGVKWERLSGGGGHVPHKPRYCLHTHVRGHSNRWWGARANACRMCVEGGWRGPHSYMNHDGIQNVEILGIDPKTSRMRSARSTTELYPRERVMIIGDLGHICTQRHARYYCLSLSLPLLPACY